MNKTGPHSVSCSLPWRWLLLLICGALAVTGCGREAPSRPAPVGKQEVLQELADAWNVVAAQVSVSPRKLPPSELRRFIEQVFEQAGYSYSASLLAMAESELDPFNEHQRDMAQLLFLPAESLDQQALAEHYSTTEIAAITSIRKTFR